MPTFEEARDLILRSAAPLGVEMVGLSQALGRVLAVDQTSAWDLPMWDNSAMDGYAVRAQDCHRGATLQVRGYLPAGKAATQALAAGTAAKILTGAPIPAGADCVVPLEVAEVQGDAVRLLVQPVARHVAVAPPHVGQIAHRHHPCTCSTCPDPVWAEWGRA